MGGRLSECAVGGRHHRIHDRVLCRQLRRAGALLQSENVVGNGGESFVGVDNFGDYIYSYGIGLPTPFTLVSGTTYWLSIMADLNPALQAWGWHTGTGGDGMAVDTILPPPSTISVDLNFALTSVPEPTSLALVGLGGFATIAFARRRRSARR